MRLLPNLSLFLTSADDVVHRDIDSLDLEAGGVLHHILDLVSDALDHRDDIQSINHLDVQLNHQLAVLHSGLEAAGGEGTEEEDPLGILGDVDEAAAAGDTGTELGHVDVALPVGLGQTQESQIHAAAVTPASLWRRYQELLSTAAVEVYYCGSADPDRVEGALRAALSALPVNENRADPDCEVRLHAGPEPRVVEEALDVTQGKLAMGFRTGGLTCWEEDYPALAMCSAVFGGTTLSKLFLNVREKLSLCYYASSTLEKMKGLLLVSSGIEFDKYETARDEILAQLEAVRRGEIEDWELEGARRTLISGHLATLDDQGRQEEFWLGQAAAGLDSTIPQLAAQFEAVTREQVAAAARKLELDTIYFLKGKGA